MRTYTTKYLRGNLTFSLVTVCGFAASARCSDTGMLWDQAQPQDTRRWPLLCGKCEWVLTPLIQLV
jgi:hypothetical protein